MINPSSAHLPYVLRVCILQSTSRVLDCDSCLPDVQLEQQRIRHVSAPLQDQRDSSAPIPKVTCAPLRRFANDPIACMVDLHEQHGDIAVLREGPRALVFAFGPEWNQRILTDVDLFHSRFFATPGPKRSAQRRLTCGLLSMNGALHRRHRRLVMQPFSLHSIEGYIAPLVEHVREMLAEWKSGEVRDIHRDMTRLMLRATSSILFGVDQPELSYKIGQMLEVWVDMNHEIGIGAIVPDETFSLKYEELLDFSKRLETAIREMINLRRNGSETRRDVLSILVKTHDQQGGMTDDELIGQAAILFGAAHLTTASSLTWTLFLLAQYPQAMRNVHQEIQEVAQCNVPQFSNLARLPCMERVIKESMRVLPASAYLPRVTTKPAQLGPFRFPPGTPIIFSQYITHHMEELFEAPHEFRPERWKFIKPSPYAYLPFSTGTRMCIGAPLAMMMLKVILPMILDRFRLSTVLNEEYSGLVRSTMLLPSTPVKMRITRQDGHFQSSPVRGNIHSLVKLPEGPDASASTAHA